MKHLIIFLLSFALVILPVISHSQTVTRGPYLQTLTHQSLKVKWRTDQPTNSEVNYGTSIGNLNTTASDPTSTTEHTVALTGLSPNTKYYYSLGSSSLTLSGPDSLHHFVTAPVPGTEQPIRIWGIGDFGKGNQAQLDVMNSYLNYTGSAHTDVWIWMGDNAYQDGTDQQYQTNVFNVYTDMFKYIPFWPCPGNHDYTNISPPQSTSSPPTHTGPYYSIVDVPTNGEAGGVASGYELYYSFDYGNIHFLSINSELGSAISSSDDWTGANPLGSFNGSPMTQWIANDMQANTKPWTIAFWHQCPYSKGSHDSDDLWELYMQAMRENIVPILESHGIDLIVCGHSHVYERSYLIQGHYGNSSTFNPTMQVDGSSGRDALGEAYTKYIDGPDADKGTVFVVAGNSGSDASGPGLNHPAMYFSDGGDGVYGSLVIDVDGDRLDGRYLRSDGSVLDHFTINKASSFTGVVSQIDVTICNEGQYFAGGAWQTDPGFYYDTVSTGGPPDTIIATNLMVDPPIATGINARICQGDSYFAGGAQQTDPGVYQDFLAAANSCDSVVTTTLAVDSIISDDVSVTICEGASYFAGGAQQVDAGTYQDNYTAVGGCDSIVTTHLSVDPAPSDPIVVVTNNSLSVGATFPSYQWYLDGSPIPGANSSSHEAVVSGDYHLVVTDANGCQATSATHPVIISAVAASAFSHPLRVFPNPATDRLLISASGHTVDVHVYDVLGSRVIHHSGNGTDDLVIDVSDMPPGLYVVRVSAGGKVQFRKIIKH